MLDLGNTTDMRTFDIRQAGDVPRHGLRVVRDLHARRGLVVLVVRAVPELAVLGKPGGVHGAWYDEPKVSVGCDVYLGLDR